MKMPRLSVSRADIGWLLLAGLTIVLQFWWLPGDGGSVADSFSSTLEGSRGLFEVLSALADDGYLPPVRREASRLVPRKPCTLLLLAPDRYPDDHEQQQLRDFVQSGGAVVFAANRVFPNRDQPEFRSTVFSCRLQYNAPDAYGLSPIPAAPAGGINSPLAPPAPDQDPLQPESSLPAPFPGPNSDKPVSETSAESIPVVTPSKTPPQPQELPEIRSISKLVHGHLPWSSKAIVSAAPHHADKLVIDAFGHTQVAAWRVGQGTFVVCATADPFSNRSMLFAGQVAFAVRLVEYVSARTTGPRKQTEIVVSEYLNGAGSYTGAAVMVSPLLRSGTLQLILVAVLLAWAGFHRFGPPLRERPAWRRSLAESAAAVGNLQFTANDGHTSVRQYYDWVSGEMRRRSGHSRLLDDPAQLARQAGLDQEQVVQALADVRLRSDQTIVTPAEAAAAIRRLARIRQKVFSPHPARSSDS